MNRPTRWIWTLRLPARSSDQPCLISDSLFVRSRLCSTLPSDGPSRDRPCALLVLHLHQVAQGTCTPKTPGMPGTQDDPAGVAAGGGALRASLTSNSPRAPLRQANIDPILTHPSRSSGA